MSAAVEQLAVRSSGFGVFAVPVSGDWLLHAPLHRQTALLNSRALEQVERPGESAPVAAVDSLRRALDVPMEPLEPREGPAHPLFLTILPTRGCNLHCVYCGFGAATAGWPLMEIHSAARAVEWMAREVRDRGDSILDVQFFGGEPFFAPDVVEVAVHRGRAVAAEMGLIPHFEALTNGFYSEERAQWIGDYFDVVVLSFDGERAVHDRQRASASGRGTFDTVVRTARILSRSQADLCIRLCVTPDNLDSLGETVQWLCEEFHPFTLDFEALKPTPDSDAAGLRPPDPYKFAKAFWQARKIARSYGAQAVYAAAIHDEPRLSFCPIGTDTVILSPDGAAAACYLPESEWRSKGRDMRLGAWDGNTLRLDQAAVEQVRRIPLEKPLCRSCFCRWSCAGACHVSQTPPGRPAAYNDFCVQTRLITALLLMDEMAATARAEALLEDREAMERLAAHGDDRSPKWRNADA